MDTITKRMWQRGDPASASSYEYDTEHVYAFHIIMIMQWTMDEVQCIYPCTESMI